jgi:hypothetical protein
MKRLLPATWLLLGFILSSVPTQAQDMGLSFSFFFPKNGEFSTPISPFSFRGVGYMFNDYVGVSTGFTLYRMTGMGVVDLPFESSRSLMGPNFTLMVPAELTLGFGNKKQELNFKGGGFAFYGFDSRIHYGNMDRALREYEGWDVANSRLEFDRKLGLGIHVGVEYIFYVNRSFGISLEGNYFMGGAPLNMRGTYTGGSLGGNLETREADFRDAKVDFTGLEISIGILFTGGR